MNQFDEHLLWKFQDFIMKLSDIAIDGISHLNISMTSQTIRITDCIQKFQHFDTGSNSNKTKIKECAGVAQ